MGERKREREGGKRGGGGDRMGGERQRQINKEREKNKLKKTPRVRSQEEECKPNKKISQHPYESPQRVHREKPINVAGSASLNKEKLPHVL